MSRDSDWLKSGVLRSALPALAGMFVIAYGLFGVRDSLFLDDYLHLCPEAGPTAEAPAGRCDADRFASGSVGRLLFPLLAGQFWIVHLLVVLNLALNVWLVFRFVLSATGAAPPAFLAAALYAFWPLHCETVFWASAFNHQAAVGLLLAAGIVWLRAAPERDGWAHRAWPVIPLVLLAGLFNAQAAAAAVALAGLTAFVRTPVSRPGADEITPASEDGLFAGGCGEFAPASSSDPARRGAADSESRPAARRLSVPALRRFALHSAWLAVPALVFGLLAVRSPVPAAGESAPSRAAAAPDGPVGLVNKFGLELRTQSRFLPGMRYSREQFFGSVRRFPEMVGEHPYLWMLLPGLAAAAVWAAARTPAPAAAPVMPDRLAGTVLFGATAWLAAVVPLALSANHCPALRTGAIGGLAQSVVAAVILWGVWGLTTGPVTRGAARIIFALMIVLGGLCNLVEGWQFRKQHEIDHAQAVQIRDWWDDGYAGPKLLLVANVQPYSQPLTVGQWDHISTVWAYPWVARAFVCREFPGRGAAFMSTGFAGQAAVRPQELLDKWESVYAFSFVRPGGAFPQGADAYHLLPARGLEFRTENGRVIRRLRLPRMAEARNGSAEPPMFAAVYVPDWMTLNWPAAVQVYEEK